ncbi:LacI family DNA-binding transcriptional regulator [Gleimia hominis]|uniref:LacI family DNA-binding transcriptional regulator n=1 Tax=Gleimia hominis TaxID=595468 RepID=UPI000C80D70F|nr:LacI family DNA-binding transcriptional regulator [Gleimia hominis]WIK64074.1 LacI family DNA-binding transcriptional regulator [Gleimia hominis]
MSRLTIRDIAQEAGVSPGAVSFALNGKPGVSEATRTRIINIANDLGWQPDPAAKALSLRKTDALGIVLTRPPQTVRDEGFYFPFLCGLAEVFAESSRPLVFRLAQTIAQEVEIYKQWASNHRVGGVVLVDLKDNDPRPQIVKDLGLASVSVGHDQGAGSSISVDDALAMHAVVNHVFAQGFRFPAYVSGIETFTHTTVRKQAFLDKARDLGLEQAYAFNSDYTEDSGAAITRMIVERHPEVDVIIYDNEMLTLGGVNYLLSQGKAIPADVGVFSWEDSVLCRVFSPSISTLSRDPEALGRASAQVLIDAMDSGEDQHRVMPSPQVVQRATTSV